MPRKSTIKTLPREILQKLNRKLQDGTLTLDDLTAWLEDTGHPRSRSALHRHSQSIEKVQARLRQSREITEAVTRELGDAATQGKQGRLLVEMARTLVFDLLMKLQELAESEDNEGAPVIGPKDIAFLGKGLAELGRALRYDQDFEEKIRKEATAKAAKVAAGAAKKAGLSKEAIAAIERDVLGIPQ